MIRRQLCLQGLALLVVLAACAVHQQTSRPEACRAPANGTDLQDCLDSLPPGATLALPPTRLVLTRPLVIRQQVTLATANPTGLDCEQGGCTTLALRLLSPGGPTQRAITIAGTGTVLDHLVIEGGKADPTRNDAESCRGAGRPSMGALAVTAPHVTITHSVLRDAACYSALVVDAGADGFRFEHNAVLANGTHDRPSMWADGLTVIDATNAVIQDNVFRDNTDVQLVLGGCRHCIIANNQLHETEAPGAGAFAALLIHAWPHTSGDYAGTTISGNTIDCGPAHACGFGLGVGGRAWYASPTAGGTIAANRITRTKIGINVDEATGPVTLRDNQVTDSGGPITSPCGTWRAGPVNIAPASSRFVDATAGVIMPAEAVTSLSFAGCLPGS